MVGSEKLLNVYIYDFLQKSSLDETAQLFKKEADISDDKPEMDAPQGFLYEWWQIFWDIFNARTNRGGSELAQKYFQMQLYNQRQENLYRGMVVNAELGQQQANQHQEFPKEFGSMMNSTEHEFSEGVGSPYASKNLIPNVIPRNVIPCGSTGAVDLMNQSIAMGQRVGNVQPHFYEQQDMASKKTINGLESTMGVSMPQVDQHDMRHYSAQWQSQNQIFNSKLSPAPQFLNAQKQLHGGSMYEPQSLIYPYNYPGIVCPIQQQRVFVPKQYGQSPYIAQSPNTANMSMVNGSYLQGNNQFIQRKRKKANLQHQHVQASNMSANGAVQMQPGQHQNFQQQNNKEFTAIDGLDSYREQLGLLERENKKAFLMNFQKARSAGTTPLNNLQLANQVNQCMQLPSSMISPQTQGSPSCTELSSQSVAVKKKYTRRKQEQSKRSISEPNSPATPLTPFTNNTLTLSSSLSTVAEIPHCEPAFYSSLFNEDDKNKKRSKHSIATHPTPPVFPENPVDTSSAVTKKTYNTTSAQNAPTPAPFFTNKYRVNNRKSPTSNSSFKYKRSSVLDTAKQTVSTARIPSVSSSSNINLVHNTEKLLDKAHSTTTKPSTQDVLTVMNSTAHCRDFNVMNNDPIHNDPILTGDISFNFDHDDSNALTDGKKTAEELSKASMESLNDLSLVENDHNQVQLLNDNAQGSFNLNFSNPNSYNDFNFFQFNPR